MKIILSIIALLIISCSVSRKVDYFDENGYRFVGKEINNKYDGNFLIRNEYGVPIIKIKYDMGNILYVKCSTPKAGQVIAYNVSFYESDAYVTGSVSNKWFLVPDIESCYNLQEK